MAPQVGDRQAIQRMYDHTSKHLQRLRSDCDMQRGSLQTVLERVSVAACLQAANRHHVLSCVKRLAWLPGGVLSGVSAELCRHSKWGGVSVDEGHLSRQACSRTGAILLPAVVQVALCQQELSVAQYHNIDAKYRQQAKRAQRPRLPVARSPAGPSKPSIARTVAWPACLVCLPHGAIPPVGSTRGSACAPTLTSATPPPHPVRRTSS